MKLVKTLLLTGENNHDWKRSAPYCKNLLEESKKFEVDLTTDPSVSLTDKDKLSDYNLFFVDYNGEDIQALCTHFKLSKDELINIHTKSTYTLAMLGFKEYFPYLFGLDERLNLPRRQSPRLHVKKGAVAIAAGQCGIYSEDSPGGWHILGYTDFDDFKNLQASDTIEFRKAHLT